MAGTWDTSMMQITMTEIPVLMKISSQSCLEHIMYMYVHK